jgi:hypothetical protein
VGIRFADAEWTISPQGIDRQLSVKAANLHIDPSIAGEDCALPLRRALLFFRRDGDA